MKSKEDVDMGLKIISLFLKPLKEYSCRLQDASSSDVGFMYILDVDLRFGIHILETIVYIYILMDNWVAGLYESKLRYKWYVFKLQVV